jgi:7-cyano-7-deazaguanine synthase in queuosine biosynthesis
MKSSEFDYTFSFGPIQNQKTQVIQYNHLQKTFVNFDVEIEDSSVWNQGFSCNSSISADMLDLALAIHAIDRIVPRPQNKSLSFYVELPVRVLDVFERNDVKNLLTETLRWYTEDNWHFEFSKRAILGRQKEIQYRFPTETSFTENADFVLWSGGLDSLAGLYTQLNNNPESNYVLVGTGSNTQVHTKQNELAKKIERFFPKRTLLKQVPYSWSNTPSSEKNVYQRARGLVFMLVGVACAYYANRKSLYVYENGIGAINLLYSKGQNNLDQAKSIHPKSLLYVSKLVSAILPTPFEIINPFWLWAKAEMVESLNNTKGIELIKLSSSCDSALRLEDGVTQCGVCSSCLLRRQAINAAGIDDPTEYHSLSIHQNSSHFFAMNYQVNTIEIALRQSDPWMSLAREYPDLDDIVDHISAESGQENHNLKKGIIRLYSKYTGEWKSLGKYIQE